MNDSSKPKEKSSCQNPASIDKPQSKSDIATSAWIDSNKNEQLSVAYRTTPKKILIWYFLLNMASFWVSMLNFRGCIHAIRFLGKAALCHFESRFGLSNVTGLIPSSQVQHPRAETLLQAAFLNPNNHQPTNLPRVLRNSTRASHKPWLGPIFSGFLPFIFGGVGRCCPTSPSKLSNFTSKVAKGREKFTSRGRSG